MQIEQGIPAVLDWLLHGGNFGALVFAAYVGLKVNNRLQRDENLQQNYPPHRHINGKVLYPKGLKPSEVDNLEGS